ncbi:unnamed protein product [Absidia cylindrospora]
MSCTPPLTSPNIPSPLESFVTLPAVQNSTNFSPPPPLPQKVSADDSIKLEEWLVQLDWEKKMKLGVENMLEAYLHDKKRTKI